ncbi:hypothetical protein CEUSTIGMA_g11208.t1 [Chlamydomonas eustigma]|uniref:CRC domain-containing protein n=1 Tax=Chlamydomonas eustigma TaxID=1157962 RepID=A0A250XL81_9CHLO|nr:hypothetical protein CEUSTIGMA_g11208.t1 [Chlamydomonas eustigma]|eukprot:GAX83783.1 hypothetical protein CEUSTIGMA_g11208.t1 [Chlamydomonas eustigma]
MSAQDRPNNNLVPDVTKMANFVQRMSAFVQHFQVAQQAVAGRTSQDAVSSVPHPPLTQQLQLPPTNGFHASQPVSHLRHHLEMAPQLPDPGPTLGNSKRCNCKKAKCLKLYCVCFSAGVFCSECACKECMNTEKDHRVVMVERQKVTQRCPSAFAPKVDQDISGDVGHKKGCRCKKSKCLKKYCECYDARVYCSGNCRCDGCHNRPEDEFRNFDDGLGGMDSLPFGQDEGLIDSPQGDDLPEPSGLDKWTNDQVDMPTGMEVPVAAAAQALNAGDRSSHLDIQAFADTPDLGQIMMSDLKPTSSLGGPATSLGSGLWALGAGAGCSSLPGSLAPSPLFMKRLERTNSIGSADLAGSTDLAGRLMSLHEPADNSMAQSLAPQLASGDAVLGATGPQHKRYSDAENMPPASNQNGVGQVPSLDKLPPGVSLMMGECGAKHEQGPTSNVTAHAPIMAMHGIPEPSEVVQEPHCNSHVNVFQMLLRPDLLLEEPERALVLAQHLGMVDTHQMAAFKAATVLKQILAVAHKHPLFQVSEKEALPNNRPPPATSAAVSEVGVSAQMPTSVKTGTVLGRDSIRDPGTVQRSSTAMAAMRPAASTGGMNSTAAQRGSGGGATPASVAAHDIYEPQYYHMGGTGTAGVMIATAAGSTPASMVLARGGSKPNSFCGGAAGKPSAMRLTSGSYKLTGNVAAARTSETGSKLPLQPQQTNSAGFKAYRIPEMPGDPGSSMRNAYSGVQNPFRSPFVSGLLPAGNNAFTADHTPCGGMSNTASVPRPSQSHAGSQGPTNMQSLSQERPQSSHERSWEGAPWPGGVPPATFEDKQQLPFAPGGAWPGGVPPGGRTQSPSMDNRQQQQSGEKYIVAWPEGLPPGGSSQGAALDNRQQQPGVKSGCTWPGEVPPGSRAEGAGFENSLQQQQQPGVKSGCTCPGEVPPGSRAEGAGFENSLQQQQQPGAKSGCTWPGEVPPGSRAEGAGFENRLQQQQPCLSTGAWPGWVPPSSRGQGSGFDNRFLQQQHLPTVMSGGAWPAGGVVVPSGTQVAGGQQRGTAGPAGGGVVPSGSQVAGGQQRGTAGPAASGGAALSASSGHMLRVGAKRSRSYCSQDGEEVIGRMGSQQEVSSGSDMRMLNNALNAMVGSSPQSKIAVSYGAPSLHLPGGGGHISRLYQHGTGYGGGLYSRTQSPSMGFPRNYSPVGSKGYDRTGGCSPIRAAQAQLDQKGKEYDNDMEAAQMLFNLKAGGA